MPSAKDKEEDQQILSLIVARLYVYSDIYNGRFGKVNKVTLGN